MQQAPMPAPTSSPPEPPERRLLREIADTSHRNGMALVRRAADIKRYLAETAPSGRMSQTKEQSNA